MKPLREPVVERAISGPVKPNERLLTTYKSLLEAARLDIFFINQQTIFLRTESSK